MNTYKMHALADYAPTIEEFGTTESYSTLLTENTHPELKERYRRSNKRNTASQMGEMERIQANTRRIVERAERSLRPPDHEVPAPPALQTGKLSYGVSLREKEFHVIGDWVKKRSGQRAVENFTLRLRNHLLGRLLDAVYDGDETDYSDGERAQVVIVNRRMYEHHDLHIRYTTYDVREGDDFIRTGTDRCDIMLRSREDDSRDKHPYWYARVLGIYHVNAYHAARVSPLAQQQMVFLHVRWFGRDLTEAHGHGPLRLTRLGWDREAEYGFVDPQHVLRACHIAPAFAHGASLHSSIRIPRGAKDWNWYYVMRWSDRDLFMRYRGGGIGHTSTAGSAAAVGNAAHSVGGASSMLPEGEVNSNGVAGDRPEDSSREELAAQTRDASETKALDGSEPEIDEDDPEEIDFFATVEDSDEGSDEEDEVQPSDDEDDLAMEDNPSDVDFSV